jgi:hypothetical protein
MALVSQSFKIHPSSHPFIHPSIRPPATWSTK